MMMNLKFKDWYLNLMKNNQFYHKKAKYCQIIKLYLKKSAI